MSSAAESRTMTSIRQDVLNDPVMSTGLLLCLLGTPGPKRAAWRHRVMRLLECQAIMGWGWPLGSAIRR